MSKELIVLGGPNGAGKSTLSIEYIAQTGYRFLSADAIAARISPSDPASAQISASRSFIHEVSDTLENGISLIIESTLSGRTAAHTLLKARKIGYSIFIAFVFVDSVELCIQRVEERVRKGEHFVPPADIKRRFGRSLNNFWTHYRPLAHSWHLLYNVGEEPKVIADGHDEDVAILDSDLFDRFKRLLEVRDRD